MLNDLKVYVCKRPPLFEKKPIDRNASIVVHKLVPRQFRVFASARHKEAIDAMGKRVSPELIYHVALLIPMIYDKLCMFSIFQIGHGKIAEAYDAYSSYMYDPKNWPALAQVEEIYSDDFNILASPVEFYKNLKH